MDQPQRQFLSEIIDCKKRGYLNAKKPLPQHLWPVKMLKRPKDCLNLHGSIFVIFFDHSKMKWGQEIQF